MWELFSLIWSESCQDLYLHLHLLTLPSLVSPFHCPLPPKLSRPQEPSQWPSPPPRALSFQIFTRLTLYYSGVSSNILPQMSLPTTLLTIFGSHSWAHCSVVFFHCTCNFKLSCLLIYLLLYSFIICFSY